MDTARSAWMNMKCYTEEILKSYFVPFYKKMARKYGREAVMEEDKAKYHHDKILTAYKNHFNVRRLN